MTDEDAALGPSESGAGDEDAETARGARIRWRWLSTTVTILTVLGWFTMMVLAFIGIGSWLALSPRARLVLHLALGMALVYSLGTETLGAVMDVWRGGINTEDTDK